MKSRPVLAVVLFAACVSIAAIGAAEPVSAATCNSHSLSRHEKSAPVYWQDGDGIVHGVRPYISLSASVTCGSHGRIDGYYGVTGQYLSRDGLDWSEHFYYVNPADKKWHSLTRAYTSIKNPWHYYDDQGTVSLSSDVTQMKVVLGVYDEQRVLLKAITMTCNPVTNTCS